MLRKFSWPFNPEALLRLHFVWVLGLALLLPTVGVAQTVDQLIAVVDDYVVLKSEVDYQYDFLKKQGRPDDGTLYCRIIENQLTEKLLLAKAKLDSLTVPADQVNSELDRRLSMIAAEYGGEEEMEREIGKSIIELRVELRETIEEQLLVEQQKSKIFRNIQVTPKEVREFFAAIPKDSLPNLPAEVAISQIILKPRPSAENKAEAKKRLAEILADIKAGKVSFEEMAERYSMDPGSKKRKGFLGEMTRGDVVPEFSAVMYNLKEGELSDVFETEFGYHIMLVHKRKGDKVTCSHILIRPAIDADDEKRAVEKLAAIRKQILDGEMTFAEAAKLYSDDQRTKENGGIVIDEMTGSFSIPLDQLDGDTYFKVDQMKEGDITEPMELIFQERGLVKAYQLIQLRKRIPPHRASLETDYQKFATATKQAKQAEALNAWFQRAKKQVYLDIKHKGCEQALQNWY